MINPTQKENVWVGTGIVVFIGGCILFCFAACPADMRDARDNAEKLNECRRMCVDKEFVTCSKHNNKTVTVCYDNYEYEVEVK